MPKPDDRQQTIHSFLPPSDEPAWEPPPWPTFDESPLPRGLFADIPYETYRIWTALNARALKHGYQSSAKHLRASLDGTAFTGDSPDRKFGRAIHCALLEPASFADRFLVSRRCTAEIKSGKRKGEMCGAPGKVLNDGDDWYCGLHAKELEDSIVPTEFVSLDEMDGIARISLALISHPIVKLVRQHGGCEVSLVWERDGLPCKARLDKFVTEAKCPDTIIDLKKCQVGRADERTLQKAVRDRGWDMQAAWYVDGVERLTGNRPHFAWIFMEDAEPFDIRPVWASKPMLSIGRAKVDRTFELYKYCLQSGSWPGYCEEIEELHPADWEAKMFGVTQ